MDLKGFPKAMKIVALILALILVGEGLFLAMMGTEHKSAASAPVPLKEEGPTLTADSGPWGDDVVKEWDAMAQDRVK